MSTVSKVSSEMGLVAEDQKIRKTKIVLNPGSEQTGLQNLFWLESTWLPHIVNSEKSSGVVFGGLVSREMSARDVQGRCQKFGVPGRRSGGPD